MFFLILILILLVIFFFELDADLTLFFYEKFSPNLNKLKGKTVWIVGCSSGIGENLTLQLAKLNCKLILTSRSTQKLIDLKQKCLTISNILKDEDIFIADFDITDNLLMKENFKKIKKHFSNIDLLINNAGRLYLSKFSDDDPKTIKDLFELNYFANINISRELINFWSENNKKGQIAVTSSTGAYMEYPFILHYSVTKKALNVAYNALRIEYKIPITLICPGPVYTGIYSNSFIENDNRNPKHAIFFNMTSERCAYLSLIGIANQLNEVWISKQYYLFLIYLGKYLPKTLNKLATFFIRDPVLKKIRKIILRN